MKKRILQNFFLVSSSVFLTLVVCCFKPAPNMQALLDWTNKTLTRIYDPPADEKLKKWELNVTDDFFLRLRKTYTNGKQEYFSCQLHNLNNVGYTGINESGLVTLTTSADDIIVQTYNDRKGDIDSMATQLSIPVKNLEAEQVDSLRDALLYFKKMLPPGPAGR